MRNMIYSDKVVDFVGLGTALLCSAHTIRKFWRELPHFFVGTGKDLRSARFVVDDVLNHLKQRGYNNGYMEKQADRVLGGKILVQKESLQEGGVSQKSRCNSMGGLEKRGVRSTKNIDPYNLLGGVGN